MSKHIEQLLNTCANLHSECITEFTAIETGHGDRDVLARVIIEHHTAERALDAAYIHELRGENLWKKT